MPNLLKDDTTVPTTSGAVNLPPGEWKIKLSTADASAAIALEESDTAANVWLPVFQNEVAVSLSTIKPSVVYTSSGEDVRVVRSGGSGAVTVSAKRVPS